MRRCRRFSSTVSAALLACAALGAGTASAATARVAPNPSATTLGAGGMTLSSVTARRFYTCTTSRFRTTLASAVGGLPLAISANVTWEFGAGGGSCMIVGGALVTFSCVNTDSFSVTGLSVARVTPALVGFTCRLALMANPAGCNVEIVGTVPARFDDATSRLTVAVAGQTLVAQRTLCPRTFPNDARVQLSDVVGMDLVLSEFPAATTISVT